MRDCLILEALHTARYLTTPQIERLFWQVSHGGHGRIKACQARLRLLAQNRLVRRIEQPVKRSERTKPYIYTLDKLGAAVLVNELGVEPAEVEWRPRAQEEHYPFLDHLLTTNEFRIRLGQACQTTGTVLQEWIDEKELRTDHSIDRVTIIGPNGGSKKVAVVPDGCFRLCHQEKCGLFFLEVDLHNVTIAPSKWERRGWMRKVRAYDAYFKCDKYRAKHGYRRARVLITTGAQARLNNIKRAIETVYEQLHELGEDTAAQNDFWLTVLPDNVNPVDLLHAPIWHIAGHDTQRALLE